MRAHASAIALVLLVACGSDDGGNAASGGASGAGASAGFAGSATGGIGGGGSSGIGGAMGGQSGSAGSSATGGSGGITLGISGNRFTLNGTSAFLLGVSYFDGRNWHASDLDQLAARKFNLIRIWLDWGTASFFDASGNLTESATLLDLVHAAADRKMVVDVTILDTDLTLSAPTTAVEQAVSALAAEPNVLFDLVNEHDHAGDTFSHDDVAALAQAAWAKNPSAILTVSSQGGHIVDDLTLAPQNIDAEIVGAGLDILTPHFTRTADFYDKTDQRVTIVATYLSQIGKNVPIYLQEEARRGHSGLDPTKDQFLQAAREARDAGAAGWNFHTDAGFDLASSTFFDALDPEEAATVDALGTEVFGTR